MTSGSLLAASAALAGYAIAEDKALATLPLALQFFATMLTSVPAALLMARVGRRNGFLLGLAVAALGAIAASWAVMHHRFALFCLGTMLVGVYNGSGIYYRFAAVEVAAPPQKNTAISYVLAGGVIAAFVGPSLAHWSRDWVTSAPFAGSYAALILLYAMSATALSRARLTPATEQRLDGGRPLLEILRQPRFATAAVGGMFGYGIMALVMTATPLAMQGCGLDFGATASVIQWHVFAMFAPSFITGHLINRFGVLRVMAVGVASYVACVTINLNGQSVLHFWAALFLLGLGWNFLFVGATSLLTETYRREEANKVQAINDFLVFTTVTVASLSAGALQHRFGWESVNIGVIPLIVLVFVTLLAEARQRAGRSPLTVEE